MGVAELTKLLEEFTDHALGMVHTSFPAVVLEYDAEKRRAKLQPSLKRRLPTGKYTDFPVINDVPVHYQGTKRFTFHYPLEENDEVAVFFSERSLEEWKQKGQEGIEDPDPRRFHLTDCYCVPGLQPVEFISATAEKGLQLIHKDKWDSEKVIDEILIDDDKIEVTRLEQGKPNLHFELDKDHNDLKFQVGDCEIEHREVNARHLDTVYKIGNKQIYRNEVTADMIETWYKDITHLLLNDASVNLAYKDEDTVTMDATKIELKRKVNGTVLIEDDHINLKTQFCEADLTKLVMELTNSMATIKLNGPLISVKNTTQSLFVILTTLLNILQTTKPTTLGSPAMHTWNPTIEQAIAAAQATLASLMEA
jgi:hypothetical protein